MSEVGRPTLYMAKYVEQVYKLCLLGATDVEIADILGVSEDTIYEWKKVHPEFSESFTRGKRNADANVAERLYQRAMGYEHSAVKIFQYEGQPVIVPYVEKFPPDTQAASLWLRNRQPDKWRDRTEHKVDGTVTLEAMVAQSYGRDPEKKE